MHQTELSHDITDVRMTVERAGNTMGGPTGVCHGSLTEEHLVHINGL